MGHDAYLKDLKKGRVDCGLCHAVIGIDTSTGWKLVICALAPAPHGNRVGFVSFSKARACPGPNATREARVAYLANPPPDP